jgi:hypothetical protein
MKDIGKFFGHCVYFTAIWYVYFMVIWYIFWSFGIFLVIWYIFWSFGIFFGHLVYFLVIWYILWPFGIFFPFWYVVPRKTWQHWFPPVIRHQSEQIGRIFSH